MLPKYFRGVVALFFISISLSCWGWTKDISCPVISSGKLYAVSAEQKYNFVLGACLLSLSLLLHELESDTIPDTLKRQFMPKNLATNFTSNYLMNFIVTFFHELGHGVAKKVLTGCDFKIHLGKNSNTVGMPILDSKYFAIDGLDSMAGFNTAGLGIKRYSPLQKILINLSGGVAGILGYFVLRTVIFLISDNSKNLKNIFYRAITLDQIVVNQVFNMIIPMLNGDCLVGDAVAVYRALGIKDGTIKNIANIEPYLAMLAFIALAFKKSSNNIDNFSFVADKILIGLSNCFLQGYLQFKC
jgi:hypothetical protein